MRGHTKDRTKGIMTPTVELRTALRSAIDYLLSYESDTFSARRSKLTQEECELIIAKIIANSIDDLDGISLNELLHKEI